VTIGLQRPRAIVVGATFGSVYAEALAASESPVELVGLLSTGSAASAGLADRLGVPLYTDLGGLPHVDVAFVVVRSGVVGGDGSQICEQLLSRGVHVLQEQPVHADEILSLLRVAAANSVLYTVNDFYSRVAPMRQFISAAQALDRIARIGYVHARSSLHVVYPLFTILADIVGPLMPAKIVMSERAEGSFIGGRIMLGDVLVDLLVQNELCASDPDNYARLMHTITVGSDAGELVLAHTHGSTRWHPRLHRSTATANDQAISEIVGTRYDPLAHDVLGDLWPNAIRLAAADFLGSFGRARTAVSQRFVRATRLWSDFTSAMGPATLIDPRPPTRVSASELMAL
jgi:pyochelin biosynthesis protein PchG